MPDNPNVKSLVDLVEIALRTEPEALPPEMQELRRKRVKLLMEFTAQQLTPRPQGGDQQ